MTDQDPYFHNSGNSGTETEEAESSLAFPERDAILEGGCILCKKGKCGKIGKVAQQVHSLMNGGAVIASYCTLKVRERPSPRCDMTGSIRSSFVLCNNQWNSFALATSL